MGQHMTKEEDSPHMPTLPVSRLDSLTEEATRMSNVPQLSFISTQSSSKVIEPELTTANINPSFMAKPPPQIIPFTASQRSIAKRSSTGKFIVPTLSDNALYKYSKYDDIESQLKNLIHSGTVLRRHSLTQKSQVSFNLVPEILNSKHKIDKSFLSSPSLYTEKSARVEKFSQKIKTPQGPLPSDAEEEYFNLEIKPKLENLVQTVRVDDASNQSGKYLTTRDSVLLSAESAVSFGSLPDTPIFIRKFGKTKMMLKSNSCSSLFVTSTPTSADLSHTIYCVSILLERMITDVPDTCPSILKETVHPITTSCKFYKSVPTSQSIYNIIFAVFNAAGLTVGCAVITFIYIKRVLIMNKLTLTPRNWLRIMMGSIIMASKVWKDNSVWNVDYHQLFPEWNLFDMNKLEKWFFKALGFDITVKTSEYTHTYFELHDTHTKASDRPLTIQEIQKMDAQYLNQRPIKALESIDFQSFSELPTHLKHSELQSISSFVYGKLLTATPDTSELRDSTGLRRAMSDFLFQSGQTPATVL